MHRGSHLRLLPRPSVLAALVVLSCTSVLAAGAPFSANGVRNGNQLFSNAVEACQAYVKGFGRGGMGGAPAYEGQGSIRCFFKDGDDEKDQIAAEVDCPQQASAVGISTCRCDGELVPFKGACVEAEQAAAPGSGDDHAPARDDGASAETAGADDDGPCAEVEKLDADTLKEKLVARVDELTQRANSEFAENPGLAQTVMTDKEVAYVFGGGGYRPNPNVKPGKNVTTMTESAFNSLYGKTLERLTARHVKGDKCLSGYLDHLSDEAQMRDGGRPDFEGKGKAKGLLIDITTEKQKARKTKPYRFITYDRLLRLDATGRAVKL